MLANRTGISIANSETRQPVADTGQMSSPAPSQDARRSRWRFSLSAKVALVLGVLVVANVAVAWGGLRAVAITNRQADELSSQYLQQARSQSDLGRAVDEAYQDALRLIPTNSAAKQAEIGRRLDEESIPAVERALATVERQEADEEPQVRALVQRVRAGWRRFLRLRRSGKFQVKVEATGDGASRAGLNDTLADQTARTVAPMLTAIDQLTQNEAAHAQQARQTAYVTYQSSKRILVAILVGSLAAAIAVGMWLTRDVVRRIRDYADFATKVADGGGTQPLQPRGSDELAALGHTLTEMQARQETSRVAGTMQAEFLETLQVTRGEEEAHALVKRHLERSIGGSSVVVLNRNNSADRLEPTTALAPDSPVAATLNGATPWECIAVRLARTHREDPACEPLLPCQVCAVTGRATCEPLLVGGEVIGSVLVQHPQPLTAGDTGRIKDSVSQAAPVLANLRNLALAEFRANNDGLTGVPNKRALQHTLKRMVAQASRSVSPLAAVMLDLDHFKQVNDVYGHEKGDEVLAAVGAALHDTLRESDFVGRYGGEEFLILLPDTDRDGATAAAETARAAVELVKVPGVDRAITASLGIAVIPDDAGDAATLLRNADKALFTAKARGRNRVEGGTEHLAHQHRNHAEGATKATNLVAEHDPERT
jgi:diguanylate cyclase (GGDEF)-like protein